MFCPSISRSLRTALALLGLATFAAAPTAAEAVTFAEYTFKQSAPDRLVSTASAGHVTASKWLSGFTGTSNQRPASSNDQYIVTGGASTAAIDENTARTNDAWLGFNITVDEDWTATLSEFSAKLTITYDSSSNARTSTWQLAVATSENGAFTSVGAPVSLDSVTNEARSENDNYLATMTVDLSGSAFSSITGGTLFFRIYMWDNSTSDAWVNRISDVHLTGTVMPASVPEPATLALLCGFAGLFVAIARRRCHCRRCH